MGLFGPDYDNGRQPFSTTVSGYGGQPFQSSEAARQNFLASIGQVHDSVTGIGGRNGNEAYENAKRSGMSQSQLDAFVCRISNS